jgi:hypothetical protein
MALFAGRLRDDRRRPLEARQGIAKRLCSQRALSVRKVLRLVAVGAALLCGVASGDLAEQDRPDSLVASFVGDSEITVAGLSKRAKRP